MKVIPQPDLVASASATADVLTPFTVEIFERPGSPD